MAIQPPPAKLIDENGRPCCGIFSAPVPVLNYLEFRRPGAGKPVSKNRIKRWEYMGIVSPEYIIGAAVVTLNFAGNAFFYVFDRGMKKIYETDFTVPFGRGISFDSNGIQGKVAFRKGRNEIIIENDREAARHRFTADIAGIKVAADVIDKKEPLACVCRVGYLGFNYTLKLAGMPAAGEIDLPDGKHRLDPARTFAVIDYTTGCLARETFWNWASGGGLDQEGNIIGLNLVLGLNETGVTENAFWVRDKMVKVDTVIFDYDDRNILSPWRIHSWDGRVDLRFSPEGVRGQSLNVGLMASKFQQPFGSFSGTLIDDTGARHVLSAMPGYVEEHYAKW